MSKTISLADGKYTIVYDEDNLFPAKCLRYGAGGAGGDSEDGKRYP